MKRGTPLESGWDQYSFESIGELTGAFLQGLRPAFDGALVLHVVGNRVVGDSRVLKCARSAVEAGHPCVIVGVNDAAEADFGYLEGVPVLRLPLRTSPAESHRNLLRIWSRWDRRLSASRLLSPRSGVSLHRRLRALARLVLRAPGETAWSSSRTPLLDMNTRLPNIIEQLEPSLVHAHDPHFLPSVVASTRAPRMRRRPARVIYDAHECFPLISDSVSPTPMQSALAAIEYEFVHYVDSVVTVSEEIAGILLEHHHLSEAPTVVLNAPLVRSGDADQSVRLAAGVAEGVPLAVYSGWIEDQRGLGLVIDALPSLPELHLVLVVGSKNKHVRRLLDRATDCGVESRVHVVPYVPPSDVVRYLASADLGLIPFKDLPHLSVSLPTKFYEYALAEVPIVASSTSVLEKEIARRGIGVTFVSGDLLSFVDAVSLAIRERDEYSERFHKQDWSEYTWDWQAEVLLALYGSSESHNGE